MNKLLLALATVAAVGLSTAAFAENPAASTSTASTQNQAVQSRSADAHKMRASHRSGAKKVVHRATLHRRAAHTRHYGHDQGKRIVVKHMPAKKTVTTKTAS